MAMIGPITGPDFTRAANLSNSGTQLGALNNNINTSSGLISSGLSAVNAMGQLPGQLQQSSDTFFNNLLGTQAKDEKGNVIPNTYNADGLLGRGYAIEAQNAENQAANEVMQKQKADTDARVAALENDYRNSDVLQKEIKGWKDSLSKKNGEIKALDNTLNTLTAQRDTLKATQASLGQAITDVADARSQQQFGIGDTHKQVYDTLNSVMTQLGGGYNLQQGVQEFLSKGMDSTPAKMLKQNGMSEEQIKQFFGRATTSWNIETERLNNENGNFTRENSILIGQRANQYMNQAGFSNQQSAFYLNNAARQGRIQLEQTKNDIDIAMRKTMMQKAVGLSDADYIQQKLGGAELAEKKRHNLSIESALRSKTQQPTSGDDDNPLAGIPIYKTKEKSLESDRMTTQQVHQLAMNGVEGVKNGSVRPSQFIDELEASIGGGDKVFNKIIKDKALKLLKDGKYEEAVSVLVKDEKTGWGYIDDDGSYNVGGGINAYLGRKYAKEDVQAEFDKIMSNFDNGAIDYSLAVDKVKEAADKYGIPRDSWGWQFRNIGKSDRESLNNIMNRIIRETQTSGTQATSEFKPTEYQTNSVSKNIANRQYSPDAREKQNEIENQLSEKYWGDDDLDMILQNKKATTFLLQKNNFDKQYKALKKAFDDEDLTEEEAKRFIAQVRNAGEEITLKEKNQKALDKSSIQPQTESGKRMIKLIGKMFENSGLTLDGTFTASFPSDNGNLKTHTNAELISWLFGQLETMTPEKYEDYVPETTRESLEAIAQKQLGCNIDNLIDMAVFCNKHKIDLAKYSYNIYTFKKFIKAYKAGKFKTKEQ